MTPTLYGPDGHIIRPPLSNLVPVESVEDQNLKAARRFRGPKAAAVHTRSRTVYSAAEEDEAIGRVMNLSAAANVDRFLPIWFGGRVLGYAQSWRDQQRSMFYKLPLGEKPLPLGCAGISSYDDILAALAAGRGYKGSFSKAHTTAPVQSNFNDLWPIAGSPGAGAYGGTALTAKQYTDATAGAIFMNGNVEPTYFKYLLLSTGLGSAVLPTLILYDRIHGYETNSFVASSQTFTNTLAMLRYNGTGLPGARFMVNAQTALGATANQISALTYTNQAGTAAQAMPTARSCFTTASATAPSTTNGARLVCPIDTGGTIQWSQYLPVASGDTGARKLEAFTCSAANTGTLAFIGLQEYMWIPLGTAGLPTQIDNVFQVGGLDRIYDGACLSLLAYFSSATAVTFSGFAKAFWN